MSLIKVAYLGEESGFQELLRLADVHSDGILRSILDAKDTIEEKRRIEEARGFKNAINWLKHIVSTAQAEREALSIDEKSL